MIAFNSNERAIGGSNEITIIIIIMVLDEKITAIVDKLSFHVVPLRREWAKIKDDNDQSLNLSKEGNV